MSKVETDDKQMGNKEIYNLVLTEWELDVIQQAVALSKFPGTHSHLASRLLDKLKDSLNGNS